MYFSCSISTLLCFSSCILISSKARVCVMNLILQGEMLVHARRTNTEWSHRIHLARPIRRRMSMPCRGCNIRSGAGVACIAGKQPSIPRRLVPLCCVGRPSASDIKRHIMISPPFPLRLSGTTTSLALLERADTENYEEWRQQLAKFLLTPRYT